MAKYNRQVATDLNSELDEIVQSYKKSIPNMRDDGPLIDDLCERLGKAISLLKTVIR